MAPMKTSKVTKVAILAASVAVAPPLLWTFTTPKQPGETPHDFKIPLKGIEFASSTASGTTVASISLTQVPNTIIGRAFDSASYYAAEQLIKKPPIKTE